MMNQRSMPLWAGLAFLACMITARGDAAAQQFPRASLAARYGWAPTHAPEAATGVGLELDVGISRNFAPTVRFDEWNFGFDCLDGESCANGFRTFAIGGKYRFGRDASVGPFLGADVGYTTWTSDVSGPSLRLRAGADIRLMRHVDLSLDGTQMRFFEDDDALLPQKQLFGFSGGLRVWL